MSVAVGSLLIPVSDLDAVKAVYTALLGAPHTDQPALLRRVHRRRLRGRWSPRANTFMTSSMVEAGHQPVPGDTVAGEVFDCGVLLVSANACLGEDSGHAWVLLFTRSL